MSYTPGPWRVEPDNEHENAIMAGQLFVAQTYGINPDSTANAHLIAAAPTMYEALIARIARHDAQIRANGGAECEDEFCNTFRPIIEAIHAHS